MAFQVSPGVQVKEVDITNVVPAVSTSIGAIAGSFKWGSVDEVIQVTSEKDLVAKFGSPDSDTAPFFFNAAQFLSYGNDLRVARINTAGLKNATSATDAVSSIEVTDSGSGYTEIPSVSFTGGGGAGATAMAKLKLTEASVTSGGSGYVVGDTFTLNIGSGIEGTIRVASVGTGGTVASLEVVNGGVYSEISGALTGLLLDTVSGSGLEIDLDLGVDSIVVTEGGSGYTSVPEVVIEGSGTGIVTVASSGRLVKNEDHYESLILTGAGAWIARCPGSVGNSIKVIVANTNSFSDVSFSDYAGLFDTAPDGDEIHIVVLDKDGGFTGTANTVLESFSYVSTVEGAKKEDGSNNFYKDVINQRSKYLWFGEEDSTLTSSSVALVYNLAGGANTIADSNDTAAGYDIFSDAETLDINLIIGSSLASADAQAVIEIAEGRKDAIAFVSPPISARDVDSVKEWADGINSSSYGVFDSSAIYVYDKYNDTYRWISSAGTIAGLCANTDQVADAWFSPAGLNRGQLRGVVKLAWNPKQAERDTLYKARVNPLVSFPGEGTVLFGDKTALAKPSAFDRINVRRLFIVLEKAIAKASRFSLFEFNDEFTRAQFRNLLEPFLRDVQGRRGITDFKVVVDETNNTGQVIDTNQFIADIYIKPARSINFITLNFVATRTGVEFSEIVGG
jgi:hypothetical protein